MNIKKKNVLNRKSLESLKNVYIFIFIFEKKERFFLKIDTTYVHRMRS